jgi:hypothetical protein
MIAAFHGDPGKYMRTINAGWQAAADHIRNAITSKDANVLVIDTLGGKYGRHPKVFPGEAAHGLAADYTQGFTPGLAKIWEQAGVEKQSVPYALGVGKKLESLMGYFGIPFQGQAHGPVSDAAATIDLLQGLSSSTRIKEVAAGIEAKSTRIAARELGSFAKYQAAFQRQHLADPQITEGARPLAEIMSSAFPEGFTRPAKTFEEAFHKLPTGTKWAAAGVGLALSYAAYRMVFAPTQRERNTQIEGLHPGAPRPGYMYGTGFGSGKIWEEIMGMVPAMKAKSGELFTGEGHGHAMMSLKKAGASFEPVRESYGFRMADKSFITRDESDLRYGIRTSEQLRVIQSTGKLTSTQEALQILIDNNNKLPKMQGAYGELPGAMKPNHNSMGASVIHAMTDFGGKYMGSMAIRGLKSILGFEGAFLSNDMLENEASKLISVVKSHGTTIPLEHQKLLSEFAEDLSSARDVARQNKGRGLPGLIAVDKGLPRSDVREIVAHERQHFYNALTGFKSGEGMNYKVPQDFRDWISSVPYYSGQIKNYGNRVISDEFLAYSRGAEISGDVPTSDIEAFRAARERARDIRRQGKLMVKQMPTAGLMHVMGDNAIRHNQMSSRVPL